MFAMTHWRMSSNPMSVSSGRIGAGYWTTKYKKEGKEKERRQGKSRRNLQTVLEKAREKAPIWYTDYDNIK